jgi:uncharacterized membrane protein
MLYLFLKFIHVVSSTILFGTGIGTASVMLYGHMTRDAKIIAAISRYVVAADWIFTASSAVVQLVTGLWLVYLAGYSFHLFWIYGALAGYVIAALCWLPVVYLQIRMRDLAIHASTNASRLPHRYFKYFRIWFCLGWPAFLSLIVVFYLMTVKPSL